MAKCTACKRKRKRCSCHTKGTHVEQKVSVHVNTRRGKRATPSHRASAPPHIIYLSTPAPSPMYPAIPPMVYPTPAPPPHNHSFHHDNANAPMSYNISRRSSIADMSSIDQEAPNPFPAAPVPVIISPPAPVINISIPEPPQDMDRDPPPPMSRVEASTQTNSRGVNAGTQTTLRWANAGTQTPRMARAQTSTQTNPEQVPRDPPPRRPMPEPAFAVPRTENPVLHIVGQSRAVEPNVPPVVRLEVHDDMRTRLRPLPGREAPVPLQQQGDIRVLTRAMRDEQQGGVQVTGRGRHQARAPLGLQGDVQLTTSSRGSGQIYNPQTAVITELPDSPRGQMVLRNNEQRLEPIVGVMPSVGGARRTAEHEGETRVVRRRVV
jgi:hypothetical protein